MIIGDTKHYIVCGDVLAPGEFDEDWTWSHDNEIWRHLTEKRYRMMKEALLRGLVVQFRSGGNSLFPFVHSKDVCFLEPIRPGCNSQILPGDIVFAAVQPNSRHYVHLVWNTFEQADEYGVQRQVHIIGNNKAAGEGKKCSGWALREDIFGILTKTQRGAYVPRKLTIRG